MASDDEVTDETSFDPTFATAGPRRSTFTPPPASPPSTPEVPIVHDDDELANALAADLGRIASGPIAVVPAAEPTSSPDALAIDLESAPPPAPETIAPAATVAAPPPWSSLPAPDPTQAVELPEGPPQRPVRRSLSESELLNLGKDQDAGTRIEQLEAQLRLRDQEAREFSAWESTMLALGTPEAVAAVEQARQEFTDLVPGMATGVVAVAPVSVPVEPPPLPAWDVPAPSATWSPEPEFVPEPEPVVEPEPEPVVEPELVVELEQAQTDGEPEVEQPSPFAPPPLVEPPPFGGPPLLPSQAAALPPLVDAVPSFSEPVPSRDEAVDDSDTVTVDIIGVPGETEVIEAEIVEPETPAGDPIDSAILGAAAAATAAGASRQFSFDDLLAGAAEDEEEPPFRFDPEPPAPRDTAPEALFIEPMPFAAGESVPTETGSVSIVEPAYEEEIEDVVDDTDRAAAGLGATATPLISPPSGPIATVRVPEDEVVLIDNEPVAQPVFRVERSGIEPTPLDHRVGRAARLFWLWFAANSSVLSLGLGATIFAVGMSLRQSIVAVLAGVALSFLPLGLTTLAGKRSGQPTMVVSRATFGHRGNVLPALVALVGRVFWGAVMLWLIASSVAIVLVGAEVTGPFGEAELLLISLAVAFLLAVLVAFTGYSLIARMQLVLSILAAVLVAGFIALTYQYVDIAVALTVPDGSWLLAVTGAVLVFSFVGLVWATSGADLARYQRPGSSGAGSMAAATFGAAVPSFLLIGYGALLAASNEGIASGFLLSPLDTLTLMLPQWYPIPLIAATTLSLLSGIVITMYSGGFALQALGVRLPRQWALVIVAGLLGLLSLAITFGVTGGLTDLFRDAATTIAVPTAAWAGIFAAETMIRNRRFESQSLVERGGVYPDWRWVNVIGFVLISAIGLGLTTAAVTWLGWQGYLFTALGVPLDSDLAGTDVGVIVALALGILLPIVAGIPAIRKQEETRVP
jgi:purine-cytosine permease-like protein